MSSRAGMRRFCGWPLRIALSHPDDTNVPSGLPVPYWSWNGLGLQAIPLAVSLARMTRG